MEKAPAELVERFKSVLSRFPEVQQRSMFGYPCAFASDQMVTGLFESSWMIRLSDDDRPRMLELEGSRPFAPMPGRPMREYVVVPPAVVQADGEIDEWIARSLAYVATLPPKPPKAAKGSKSAKASKATKAGR